MFSEADKKLFKIIGLLCIPAILAIPFGMFLSFITFPLGIFYGWAVVTLIEHWRNK